MGHFGTIWETFWTVVEFFFNIFLKLYNLMHTAQNECKLSQFFLFFSRMMMTMSGKVSVVDFIVFGVTLVVPVAIGGVH